MITIKNYFLALISFFQHAYQTHFGIKHNGLLRSRVSPIFCPKAIFLKPNVKIFIPTYKKLLFGHSGTGENIVKLAPRYKKAVGRLTKLRGGVTSRPVQRSDRPGERRSDRPGERRDCQKNNCFNPRRVAQWSSHPTT
jgi:hypothetical protein